MPPRRGRVVLCTCSRCLQANPDGRLIISADQAQHLDRDIQRELRGTGLSSRGNRSSLSPSYHQEQRGEGDRAGGGVEWPSGPSSGSGVGLARRASEAGSDQPVPPEEDPEDEEDRRIPDRVQVQSESDDLPWLRLFMLLILWLSCARGLSKACARIILSFLTDLLLPVYGISAPRNISTVLKQLGHQASMVKFAICSNHDCQRCWRAGVAPESCDLCGTAIFVPESRGRPVQYFHYGSVIEFLQDCFQDPRFEAHVNQWRSRTNRSTLSDIYDGTAWNSDGFLDNRLHLYLSVGIDWFVPFSFGNTASYTIGALSIRVENLPPSMRNQPEFMHVAAILPGPRQTTDAGLVAAMKPLIDDLRKLFEGVEIHTPGYPLPRVLKAKVLMALGDTPARAKLAGFPSHTQHGRWCGYCLADSHTWVESLMRHEAVPPRDPDMHRNAAFVVKETPAARDETIRVHAATWTALYDLPYWRSVTDVPVDAMHVLHLGACKRFWHATLVDGNLLPTQFPIIASVIKSATFPRGLTAIRPTFGTTKGGSPTSDAWSTFARFLLPLVLASHWSETLDIDGQREFNVRHKAFRLPGTAPGVPTPMFRCNVAVRHLVRMGSELSLITHIVQSKELTEARIGLLERTIRDHVFSTASHIDPRWLVPNHHALTHLPNHIRRFGPPREFWFYSMERLNGFLKKTVHNEHHGGELEYAMQANHSLYRTVRTQIRQLKDSDEEKIFRRLLIDEEAQLDPFQVPDGDQEAVVDPAATRPWGKGTPILLVPTVVNAIVTMINSTRGVADPLAAPEFAFAGNVGETMPITSEALNFPYLLVRSVKVSPANARINVAKGASNIIINSNGGYKPARLVSIFEHTYANPRQGQLIRRSYAEVEVFRHVSWPHQHVLEQWAPRLGYHLYNASEPQPGVVPLANIVDTYVSATAKYITEGVDDMFAAALHPQS
ncbi:hypothetical protein CF319_g1611 [Tilletia indica]|nr:hypothetical protein CF319_g1611 [Tilletia indica]